MKWFQRHVRCGLAIAFTTTWAQLTMPTSSSAEPTDLIEANRAWPSWRGPAGNGSAPVDAHPPITWDAKTNIKWVAPVPGEGSATPIVWDDQLFVLSAQATDRPQRHQRVPIQRTRLRRQACTTNTLSQS